MLYLFFKANYPLLRHRHGSDCLYVIVSGSAVMGRQTLNVGDSFFVPANAPYSYTAGPEGVEVLEIRHDVESVSTSYIGDPPGRLEQIHEAVRTNTTAWNDVRNRAAAASEQRRLELTSLGTLIGVLSGACRKVGQFKRAPRRAP